MTNNKDENKELLAQVILKHPGKKSCAQVAHELSQRLGRTVSESMLYSFTKQNRSNRFPAAWVGLLYEITGDARYAISLLPEHHRTLIAIGENVVKGLEHLERAVELVKQLEARTSRKNK